MLSRTNSVQQYKKYEEMEEGAESSQEAKQDSI